MGNKKLELYSVVSKGQIAKRYDSNQVNKNLQARFKLNEQMEYDADHYEALIAGSDHFTKNAIQLRILSEAYYNANMCYSVKSLAAGYFTAGIDFTYKNFYLDDESINDNESVKIEELKLIHKLHLQLEQVDALFYQRIILAVKNMPLEQQKRCRALIKTLQKIYQLNKIMRNLTYVTYIIKELLEYEQQDDKKQTTAIPVIKEQLKYCANYIGLLLHASDLLSLTAFQLIDVSQHTIKALEYQYVWIFGELVTLCEAQEKSMGLQPIKLVLMNQHH